MYNMKLPTLYRKNPKGKVYIWNIEVKKEDQDVLTIVSYGMIDGKQQEQRRKVVAKGKNTCWEQGVREIKKKWNDRINKSGYTETIQDRPF